MFGCQTNLASLDEVPVILVNDLFRTLLGSASAFWEDLRVCVGGISGCGFCGDGSGFAARVAMASQNELWNVPPFWDVCQTECDWSRLFLTCCVNLRPSVRLLSVRPSHLQAEVSPLCLREMFQVYMTEQVRTGVRTLLSHSPQSLDSVPVRNQHRKINSGPSTAHRCKEKALWAEQHQEAEPSLLLG